MSDRISAKRRQYRDDRRNLKSIPGSSENGALKDEDEESLERKVARLRKEVAEVKGEYDRRKIQNSSSQGVHSNEEDGLDALANVLSSVNAETEHGAARRVVKRLSTVLRVQDSSPNNEEMNQPEQNKERSTYTISYAPGYQQTHLLSKVADFDARLALIESVLGAEALLLTTQERLPVKAVLPLLDDLDRQISTLSSSTDASLDSIDRRVRQLTQDAHKLVEVRTAAKVAQDALNSTPDHSKNSPETTDGIKNRINTEDPEQTLKINALYGALPTIESLAPLLPSLLDRLRSLQLIHAGAAEASQNLSMLESRQENMAEDLKSWREGLQKVEMAMKQGEQTAIANAKMVEGWVKELEDRMQRLS